MKTFITLLLLLNLAHASWIDDQLQLPSTQAELPPIQSYEQPQEQPREYYPTQTDPAPGVMYDYRTPSYDIYNYNLAPQD